MEAKASKVANARAKGFGARRERRDGVVMVVKAEPSPRLSPVGVGEAEDEFAWEDPANELWLLLDRERNRILGFIPAHFQLAIARDRHREFFPHGVSSVSFFHIDARQVLLFIVGSSPDAPLSDLFC